jgi:dipeptidyl aminopeptidase/acylaminoacyl peptidase
MDTFADFIPPARLHDTFALSADGSRVAYVDDGPGQFNLAVRSLAGGPARYLTTYTESMVRRVAWHPNGRSVVYLADLAGDESFQVYLVDVAGGPPQHLAGGPDVRCWLADGGAFSPDGRYLAYAANDRDPAVQDALVRDLTTGEVRRVYAGGGRIYVRHWSPDGTWLSVIDLRSARSAQVVYLVPVDGGDPVRLTPPDSEEIYWPGPWLPDGSGLLTLTDAGRGRTGLAVLDAVTGAVSWMDTPDSDVEAVARAADIVVWLVNVDGASRLRARDLSTGRDLAVPDLPLGVADGLQLTPDGRTAVLLMSTPARPSNLLTVDLTTGGTRWLTDLRPRADPGRFVDPVPVRCPARGGRHVPGNLFRPATTTGRIPVVVAIHGGPPVQERPDYTSDGLFPFLVSRGVAVLSPNIRGSSGYGRAYQNAVHRDWGGVDLDDLDDATRWLKEQPWVDPARIGLFGRSYGGFAVLSCVTRLADHDWAAAVAWCGPSDLVTFSRAQPPTWREQVAIMIGDPDVDEEFLRSRSPITFADRIRAPMFLIHGANDIRVSRHEGDQIVARLRDYGIPVRYDVYPGEGHVFGSRENQAKARSDAADFLLTQLLGTARSHGAGIGQPPNAPP